MIFPLTLYAECKQETELHLIIKERATGSAPNIANSNLKRIPKVLSEYYELARKGSARSLSVPRMRVALQR